MAKSGKSNAVLLLMVFGLTTYFAKCREIILWIYCSIFHEVYHENQKKNISEEMHLERKDWMIWGTLIISGFKRKTRHGTDRKFKRVGADQSWNTSWHCAAVPCYFVSADGRLPLIASKSSRAVATCVVKHPG